MGRTVWPCQQSMDTRRLNLTRAGNTMIKLITSLVLIIGLSTTTRADSQTFAFDQKDFPEVHCLALNIYYEARGSNFADQVGVADVVLNRVNDRRYPDSVCGVVQQGKKKPSWKDQSVMVMVRNMCQFSWYCDGKADNPHQGDAWVNAQTVAWRIMQFGEFRGISEGATHYHATYVNPAWNKYLRKTVQIQDHVFYK